MANLPRGHVAHLTNGRLRIKIPQKRGDPAFFKRVEEKLGGWHSIDRIETNHLTGSVLVFFSDLAALFAENAVGNEFFEVNIEEFAVQAGELTEQAVEIFHDANTAMRRMTGGAADLRSTIFVVLLLGGFYQLLRGNIAAQRAAVVRRSYSATLGCCSDADDRWDGEAPSWQDGLITLWPLTPHRTSKHFTLRCAAALVSDCRPCARTSG